MKLVRMLLRDSKRAVFFAAACGALSGACTATLLSLVHQAIEPSSAGARGHLALQYSAIGVLFLIASLGSHIPLLHLSEGATLKLRLHLVQTILQGRLRFLEELGSHRLYAALAGDVDRIANGFAVLPAILISCVILSGCLIYLGSLSWRILVALLLFLLFAIVVFVAANSWAVRRLSRARELGDVLFKQFRGVSEGTKELKLHSPRRRDFLDTLLFPAADAFRRHRIVGLSGIEAANAIANLGFFAVIGMLVFLLPALATTGGPILGKAVLVFVFMLAPLTTLGNHFHTFAQAGVALRKIESLEQQLGGEQDGREGQATARPASARIERVVVERVTYTYPGRNLDERFTLGPLSVEIRPAEILFVTGGNGSGKSTLGKLIAGLYVPDTGSIALNGEPIIEENREWYRQHFTAIFGDFYLFERLLGIDAEGLDEKARHYLGELHLEEKVKIESGELSTTNLSTGQRKRLALLVAYLEDRPIYLFDEWAADQDPQFKEIFYSELLPELKSRGKTVIVITHDDRYFPRADRILKLADGKLEADVPAYSPRRD